MAYRNLDDALPNQTAWGKAIRAFGPLGKKRHKKPPVHPSEKWSGVIRDEDGRIIAHTDSTEPEPVSERPGTDESYQTMAESIGAESRAIAAKEDAAPRRRAVSKTGAKARAKRKSAKSKSRSRSNRTKEVQKEAISEDGVGGPEAG